MEGGSIWFHDLWGLKDWAVDCSVKFISYFELLLKPKLNATLLLFCGKSSLPPTSTPGSLNDVKYKLTRLRDARLKAPFS